MFIPSDSVEEGALSALKYPGETEAEMQQRKDDPDAMAEIYKCREQQSIKSVVQDQAIPPEQNSIPLNVKNDPLDINSAKVIAAIDVAIDIALVLREASEASSVLTPLKVVCTVTAKVLQDTRVSGVSTHDALSTDSYDIQERLFANVSLSSLADHLEVHHKFIHQEAQEIETRGSKDAVFSPQEGFLTALNAYLT